MRKVKTTRPDGESSLPCAQDGPPHKITHGCEANKHHDSVPEVPGILITHNLEVAVVENLQQKVERLSFVGEIDAGIIQWYKSSATSGAHAHVHGDVQRKTGGKGKKVVLVDKMVVVSGGNGRQYEADRDMKSIYTQAASRSQRPP
jgi:hypothetical protein